jgi:hypothetical protein
MKRNGGNEMDKNIKKIIIGLVIAGIIFISTFSVFIHFQIENIIESKKEPLFVEIKSDNQSGYPPFEVNFKPMVINYKGNLIYDWDFGDGTTSNERYPKHIYNGNGTFICKLTVSDDNDIVNDSIKITSLVNHPPSVTIFINNVRLKRKYKIGLPVLAGKNGLYLERFKALIPKSLKNKVGPITCTAQVDDPEGDEIVSYEWKLKPPSIITFMGKDLTPTYIYEGKEVTFSFLETYAIGLYNLVLNVTDSHGQTRSTSIIFEIQASQFENTRYNILNSVYNLWLFINTLKDLG